MRLAKRLLAYTVLIIMAILLFGCIPLDYPVYKTWDDSVEIDGVEYKMLLDSSWEIDSSVNRIQIGYAGSYRTSIYKYDGDFEENTILLMDLGSSMWRNPYFRSDTNIIQPISESINRLKWSEFDKNNNSLYTNDVFDKESIIQLFDLLENGQAEDSSQYNFTGHEIFCYSNKAIGLVYRLQIKHNRDKIIIGNVYTGRYVLIPLALIESIAGHDVDILES